jgi:hypothetical protein
MGGVSRVRLLSVLGKRGGDAPRGRTPARPATDGSPPRGAKGRATAAPPARIGHRMAFAGLLPHAARKLPLNLLFPSRVASS